MMEMLEKTAAALERRHFKAAVFKTAPGSRRVHPVGHADGASRCIRRPVPPVSRWGWLSSCAKTVMRFFGIGKPRLSSVPRCFIER